MCILVFSFSYKQLLQSRSSFLSIEKNVSILISNYYTAKLKKKGNIFRLLFCGLIRCAHK